MKLVMDIHRNGDSAQVAAVAFEEWAAAEAAHSCTTRIAQAEKAPRGELDLRDLPCLLQLLHQQALSPQLILFEGLVHLDAHDTPGLGLHLFHALGGRCAVIGIAKAGWPGVPAQFEVMREPEASPVIVTCAGMDLGAAKTRVRAMHGRKRMPTLLKLAARLAKQAG